MVKLSNELLKELVFTRTGINDTSVIIGPRVGEDAAIIDLGNGKYLVTHTDPITGALENLGWLAINIPANDIAVRGVKPRWFLLTLLLPRWFTKDDLSRVMIDIDLALKEIGATLVGGHTEYSPGIDRPIASVTAIGIGSKYVTTSSAKPGDYVLVTKYVAIEGTAVLANDYHNELMRRGIPRDVINRARGLIKHVSVVRDALEIADLVNSMHDPTEGGLLQGLLEIAETSGVRIRIYEDKIPILSETRDIFKALGLDPLKSLSSGMLVATLPKERIDETRNRLERLGINAIVIGETLSGPVGVELVRKDGSVNEISGFVEDDVMRFIEMK